MNNKIIKLQQGDYFKWKNLKFLKGGTLNGLGRFIFQ